MNFRSLVLSVSALLALGAANIASAQGTFFSTGIDYRYKETFDTQNADAKKYPPALNVGWFAFSDETGNTALGFTSVTGDVLPTTSQGIFRRPDIESTDWALGTRIIGSDPTFYYGVAVKNDLGFGLKINQVSLTANLISGSGAIAEYRWNQSSYGTLGWQEVSDLSLTTDGQRTTSIFNSRTLNSGETLWFRWKASGEGASTMDTFRIMATPVPEPSTYAMLLGLGTVGFVCYRRRTRK